MYFKTLILVTVNTRMYVNFLATTQQLCLIGRATCQLQIYFEIT